MQTEKAISIQLPCPCCGEPDANIALQLWDGNFYCHECENEFSADTIRAIMLKWPKILAWVEQMPTS